MVRPAVVRVGQNVHVLRLPSDIRMRACETVVKRPIPPLTLCRCITPKHDQVTVTLSTKSICACSQWDDQRWIFYILKGIGWFTTVMSLYYNKAWQSYSYLINKIHLRMLTVRWSEVEFLHFKRNWMIHHCVSTADMRTSDDDFESVVEVTKNNNLFIWGFTLLSTLYRSYHDG